MRVGAISWDASLPAETYFGYYQTRTLSPKKYREYTPYYADIIGAERLADWIRSEAKNSLIGHILAFAWNEFEEGAWICPTYRPDLTVNEERVRTFKEISHIFKSI